MTNAIQIIEENLRNYLLNDLSELEEIVCELNSWNGSLEDLRVYNNDGEFFEMMFDGNAMEAVRASQYGNYNYNDDYVKFNGYGNLESFSEYEYEELLKSNVDEIIEALTFNIDHISVSSELEDIVRLENELDELIDLHQSDDLGEDEIERYKDLAQEMTHVDIELPFELLYEHE